MKIPLYHLAVELVSSVIIVLLLTLFFGFDSDAVVIMILITFACIVVLSFPSKVMVKNWKNILGLSPVKLMLMVAVICILMLSGFLSGYKIDCVVGQCEQPTYVTLAEHAYIYLTFGNLFSNNPITKTVISSQGGLYALDFILSVVVWYLMFSYISFYIESYKNKRNMALQASFPQ